MNRRLIALVIIGVVFMSYLAFRLVSDNPLSHDVKTNQTKIKQQNDANNKHKPKEVELNANNDLEEKYKNLPEDQKQEAIADEKSQPISSKDDDIKNIAIGFSNSLLSASKFQMYDGIAVNIDDSYFPSIELTKSITDRGKYVLDQLTIGHTITNVKLYNKSIKSTNEFVLQITYQDQDDSYYIFTVKDNLITDIKKEDQ